jgi:hypothetical protein
MDRALARPRIHRFIAQALLGLLLFAWLPVAEGASSPFLNDPAQVLSLAELPDGAEADGEACGDAFEDGDGGLDDLVITGSTGRLSDDLARRRLNLSIPGAVLIAGLSGVPHATGPPKAAL